MLAALEGDGQPQAAPRSSRSAGPAATLARFMDESRSIPTATSFRTLTVDVLDARRRELKAAGRKLSFTHLIAWAIVQAARDMPVMGNSYSEEDGKPQRVVPAAISLGLAVDVERKDGTRSLVVPVLAGASELSFTDFVGALRRAGRGRARQHAAPDAYTGANVSLTNPGGIGTIASVPRLMPGQGTIVATGAIGYPPGLGAASPDALRELGVQKVMTMTSTYDHRVIQGAESGAFLRRVDQLLQGEDGFYEGVLEALGLDGVVEGAAGPAPVTADEPVPAATTPAAAPVADEALLQAVQAATSLVKAHRMHGHLAARLDPLGSDPVGDPALDPATVHLTEALMRRIPASVLRVAVPGETFADALPALRDVYTGSIAYEIEHISDHEQRVWLRQAIEAGTYRQPLEADERRFLLERLSKVEALETYLHKAFLGKKQFSIEGLDALVPMLDQAIELASDAGAREVVLGHGAPRPPERARPQRLPALRVDPGRVRGRADALGRHGQARGRHGRREVPLRRLGHLQDAVGPRRDRDAVAQPEPPGVRQPGHRGPRPRRPDEPQGARARPRPERRAAGADPRRRRLPRPGHRGRDAQPPGARGLLAPAARCT